MTVFDANVMIGRWPTSKLKFSTADEVIKLADYHSINKALVYSARSVKGNPLEGNMDLMEQIKGYPDRLLPCWVIMPTWKMETGHRMQDDLKKYGVKAVRLFSKEHSYLLDDWVCGAMFRELEEIRMPVLFDGPDVSLTQLHTICGNYPKLPVVLTQCEYFMNRSIYALFALHQNFYMEISTYFIYYGIEDIVQRFGAERLIFGSRMPFQEAGAVLMMVHFSDISSDQADRILHTNLEQLIGGVIV